MDKSRQKFEGFIKFHLGDKVDENTYETANNGLNYSYPYVDLMWITWKASRESLEIELPSDVITGHDGMFDEGLAIGYNNALEECKEILDRNGVKIKNE
ncbi:hypothetical protein [Proteus terrae]|uniref:hypothetical protein n=1 Tax=Proteus terrae TaxID=1574161 RepID=UPI0034D503A9